MAFESLSDKLHNVFSGLKGKGVLAEKDIDKALREVKLALLEADVNFKVVKEFVAEIKDECMGEEVMQSLTPAQRQELRRCLLEGLARVDYLLPPDAFRAAKEETVHERNYRKTMKKMSLLFHRDAAVKI